jgi:hypothetical protein
MPTFSVSREEDNRKTERPSPIWADSPPATHKATNEGD